MEHPRNIFIWFLNLREAWIYVDSLNVPITKGKINMQKYDLTVVNLKLSLSLPLHLVPCWTGVRNASSSGTSCCSGVYSGVYGVGFCTGFFEAET